MVDNKYKCLTSANISAGDPNAQVKVGRPMTLDTLTESQLAAHEFLGRNSFTSLQNKNRQDKMETLATTKIRSQFSMQMWLVQV